MRTRQWLLNALTAAILVGLGACGGGGGDDTPAGPTIDISTVNRDTVAHATVAGVFGLTLGTTTPLASGSSGSARSMAAWLQTQSARLASAATQREHPMAVFGPTEAPCGVSGSMTVTWDDADNDRVIGSAGDVLTGVFTNCVDPELADATVNGTMVARVLSDTDMRMEMTQLSFDTSRHSMTVNGTVRLTMVSVDTAQTKTEGAVTVNVALNHLAPPFTDTVTLQSGFVAQETITNGGEFIRTVNGLLESAAAGGVVRLTTPSNTPIRQFETYDYPYTGVLQVKGMNSALQMTVLSADQVRLDLDADNNGSFESTSTVPWDWLL